MHVMALRTLRESEKSMQEKQNGFWRGNLSIAQLSFLSLFCAIVALPLALMRFPLFPAALGISAIWGSYFVFRDPQAEPKQKLMAAAATILGIAALLVILVFWL